ncbi:MAG: class I SAM-dependent methyltransferase [Candidatus Thorarchaeota archaeon]
MSSFDNIALAYDNSIDWDARLRRELPLILSSLPKGRDKRVLDIACGSGRHSVALALESAEVIGVDVSPDMIAAAKKLAEENLVTPTFKVLDMLDLEAAVREEFDLIICLGNSLALSHDRGNLGQLIRTVYSKLADNGTFLFQVLNFEAVRKSQARFFPSKGGRLSSGEEIVFSRFFDNLDEAETATLVLSSFIKTHDGWQPTVSYQQVLQLNLDIIQDILTDNGFITEYYSDYSKSPFDRSTHRNIIGKASKN